MEFASMSKEQLLAAQQELTAKYEAFCAMNLNLDLSRGKPGRAQLDLNMDMLNVITTERD